MIIAIIQARMNSTRLPGKILLPLVGEKTALECMLERVKKAKKRLRKLKRLKWIYNFDFSCGKE